MSRIFDGEVYRDMTPEEERNHKAEGELIENGQSQNPNPALTMEDRMDQAEADISNLQKAAINI